MATEKAFPLTGYNHSSGMDLRDYFAAKAMQVYLSNSLRNSGISDEGVAKGAYVIADKMIIERQK